MSGIHPITAHDHRLTPAVYPHEETRYHMEVLKDHGVTCEGDPADGVLTAVIKVEVLTDTRQSIGEQVVEELTGVIEAITKRRVVLGEVVR